MPDVVVNVDDNKSFQASLNQDQMPKEVKSIELVGGNAIAAGYIFWSYAKGICEGNYSANAQLQAKMGPTPVPFAPTSHGFLRISLNMIPAQ
jgi:hypothetical protein